MANTFSSTSAHCNSWNGPICHTCSTRYLGTHACSQEDILRRVNELLGMLAQPGPARNGRLYGDRTASCPCRPENGGSGICGCINRGPEITC